MQQETYLTKEGLEALKAELEDLKINKRKDNAEAIATAKEHGDLSENAEYVQAKDEQRRIESRINELEDLVKHAQVVKKSSGSNVSVGSVVTLTCSGDEKTYQIVGSTEANPLEGKISNESPVGKALLGKKLKDNVELGSKACTIEKVA